jgi:hypothetical protein
LKKTDAKTEPKLSKIEKLYPPVCLCLSLPIDLPIALTRAFADF